MDIVMPQMGESVTEGTVTAWLKAPGDVVEKDEPLLEIQTDKVDTVIDCPESGTLAEIVIDAGETVAVGVVLGRLATAAHAVPAAPDAGAAHFGSGDRPEVVAFARSARSAEPTSRPRRYSPAVLAAAAARGITPDQLPAIVGTGSGGRVTVGDVTAAFGGDHSTTYPHAIDASGQSTRDGTPPAEYLYRPTPRDEVVPMSATRRRIANHMSWSRRISAHATAYDEIEVGALAQWIADTKASGSKPVTWTAAIACAAVVCLGEFPSLNAAVVGDQIAFRPYVHLGIAVAADGELVVPVVADAHLLDIHTLAARIADVTSRARARQLDHRDVRGGTFTYSNPGIVGGLFGTPVLNQPQVGLLSTNAVRDRPWVVDGAVVVRPVMGVSLAFDHRLVDGLMAFQFIESLRLLVADPDRLIGARQGAT